MSSLLTTSSLYNVQQTSSEKILKKFLKTYTPLPRNDMTLPPTPDNWEVKSTVESATRKVYTDISKRTPKQPNTMPYILTFVPNTANLPSYSTWTNTSSLMLSPYDVMFNDAGLDRLRLKLGKYYPLLRINLYKLLITYEILVMLNHDITVAEVLLEICNLSVESSMTDCGTGTEPTRYIAALQQPPDWKYFTLLMETYKLSFFLQNINDETWTHFNTQFTNHELRFVVEFHNIDLIVLKSIDYGDRITPNIGPRAC
ncbi:hypothetical protein CcNV_038 [Crangon crangon nudivirus]|uniref:Uncharacterized protein n=1 Tax=Crangon crangon nudivirus TaxID=2880838 RepID=A0AAE9BZQ3_9VIRU|nr:hypothetical protein QKT25_gp038 [Crangon crangon nudivirus]UBZ25522.1 hypothetical protein CcNV_038 [Crangon crangon nudivirus]